MRTILTIGQRKRDQFRHRDEPRSFDPSTTPDFQKASVMIIAVMHWHPDEAPLHVADVEVGDLTGDEALEFAYLKTQNIHGSWSRDDLPDNRDRDPRVTVTAPLHRDADTGRIWGHRSSSIFDKFVMDGMVHEVGMVGFKALGPLTDYPDIADLLRSSSPSP